MIELDALLISENAEASSSYIFRLWHPSRRKNRMKCTCFLIPNSACVHSLEKDHQPMTEKEPLLGPEWRELFQEAGFTEKRKITVQQVCL